MGPSRVVVVNDLSVTRGGATAVALASATGLRAKGYGVTLLVGDEGDNPELAAKGIEIVGLAERRLLARGRRDAFVNGLFNRAAERMMAGWIARFDTPDTVYHLHGWSQILSPAVFAAFAPVRDRLVVSAHDFFLVCPNGAYTYVGSGRSCPHVPLSAGCVAAQCDGRSYAHKLWRVARQMISRHWYRGDPAPRVLAVHPAMAPLLERGGIERANIATLPNPAKPFSDRPACPEQSRELIYVGRIEANKGPQVLLEAARRAGARVRLFGEGSLRTPLEQQYPEHCFMGFQPSDEIGRWLNNARALVMPSLYREPFGLVAVEAMWSGLPVILSSNALLADDVLAAQAGLSFPAGNVDALTQVLRHFLANDALAGCLGRNASSRTRHLANTPKAFVDSLAVIYQDMLADARTRAA